MQKDGSKVFRKGATISSAGRNLNITLPETNIASEIWCLEDYFPFGKACFQVLC